MSDHPEDHSPKRTRDHIVSDYRLDAFDTVTRSLLAEDASLVTVIEQSGFAAAPFLLLAATMSERVLTGDRVPDEDTISLGAASFSYGLLVGVRLSGVASRRTGLELVPTHVLRAISKRGRYAIIAERCDLSAVATAESAFTNALLEKLGDLPSDLAAELDLCFTQLFESGLAAGLLNVDAAEKLAG